MKTASIFVRAFWDDDAKVWVATSNDIEGLSVEGATHEELSDKVVAAVADLIELNGVETDLPEIPVPQKTASAACAATSGLGDARAGVDTICRSSRRCQSSTSAYQRSSSSTGSSYEPC